MKTRIIVMVVLAMATLVGCKESTSPKEPLNVPGTYDTLQFAANASAELLLRTQLSGLTTLMKTGRMPGTSVDLGALTTAFAPLAEAAGSYGEHVTMALNELSKASGGSYDPRRTVALNGEGGVYGSYLFDETGLEMEQIVEKGLFSAMMYRQAVQLMTPDATAADVDRIVALFGAGLTFPNSDKASSPDRFSAAYAARRDKNDGKGYYTQIALNVRRAQAAIKAGNEYDDELMAAFGAIRDNWERAIVATAINYMLTSTMTFASTSPSDAALSGALHAYGEAVGFLRGLQAVAPSQRRIGDAVLDDVLAKLRAPMRGEVKPYVFVTTPVTTLPDIEIAIDALASTYGFTSADLVDFRTNWVNQQNRQ